jgi:chromosome segregation ATPase
MRWTALLLGAHALLRGAPCRPCTGLLEEADASPCGCGFGLVRKVRTREELEALSQAALDKLLCDSENELDELKGSLKEQEKEHAKALDGLNTSTKDLKEELWGAAADAKATYQEAQANYSGEAETVAQLEEDLQNEAHKVTDLKFEFSQVQEDVGFKLMVLENCKCEKKEEKAEKAEAADEATTAAPAAAGPSFQLSLAAVPSLRAQLAALRVELRSEGPERVKQIETAMQIERVETELVTVTKALDEEQSAYDAAVRGLGDAQEAMKRNASSVSTKAVSSQSLMNKRAEAQGKAQEALGHMVAVKKAQAESAQSKLESVKKQVKELEQALSECGCKS